MYTGAGACVGVGASGIITVSPVETDSVPAVILLDPVSAVTFAPGFVTIVPLAAVSTVPTVPVPPTFALSPFIAISVTADPAETVT